MGYVVMKVLMGFRCSLALLLMVAFSVVYGGNVTYDTRSLIIDGQHKILFSGSIHYPRSTPEMWPALIAKAKEGGLDVIQTYVFWNLHEPREGQYAFDGRYDLIKFIKEIQAQGLYVTLRIGPFIESEWTYGGFPTWLHDIPDIIFRTDNEPFKFYMQNFTTKIVNMMKSANLYASQGGPIILSQIENEYGMVEGAFHEGGIAYSRWAAQMAVGLQTGVPWIMCKQNDAPDLVINTCNGLKCGETFKGPNSPNKPSLWTENWTSQYSAIGEETRLRSIEDIAYHVTLFIVKNGSYVNYYMYHGGTNFDRKASAFVTTAYYDDAPLDEYGMVRQPKWGHLKELHAAIKSSSDPLLYGTQTIINLGAQQEAYVFNNSKICAVFLENSAHTAATVQFQNVTYRLRRQSFSILPDCRNVTFNTAKVTTQHNTRTRKSQLQFSSTEKWKMHKEVIPNYDGTSFKDNKLLDHINITKDHSDYLWYTYSMYVDSPDTQSALNVLSRGHVLKAFVNGVLVGSAHGRHRNTFCNLDTKIHLTKGENNISLLSATVGFPDSGAYLEHKTAGLYGVTIDNEDLTNKSWGYQVGLSGESLQIYEVAASERVYWENFENSNQSLTWYKSTFDAPAGNDPVALNLGSMGKGQAWVNGQNIGRYWVSFNTSKGIPSQQWYHIPRSFLKPDENLLVLFEEEYGNPLKITLDTVVYSKVEGPSSYVNKKKKNNAK